MSPLGPEDIVPIADGEITFYTSSGKASLRLCQTGEIFVDGRLAGTDAEVVEALRGWLATSRRDNPKEPVGIAAADSVPVPGTSLHAVTLAAQPADPWHPPPAEFRAYLKGTLAFLAEDVRERVLDAAALAYEASPTDPVQAAFEKIRDAVESVEDQVTCDPFCDPRQRLIDLVRSAYCLHCGTTQPKEGRRCQCWNDE
jgi:hypothetical protein